MFVFNPVGLGGLRVDDQLRPADRLHRPGDGDGAGHRHGLRHLPRRASGDAERWDAQARRVLAALLHAAALGGGSMRDVLGWVADNDRAAREVPALLRRSQVEAFEKAAEQFVDHQRPHPHLHHQLDHAGAGVAQPPDAAAAAVARGRRSTSTALLESRATVFLLGAEEADTGPLVCALTGHIAREARRLAASCPGGRLDPPLLLALDEAALISPVPLENWTADMGGRGVTIIAPFQSRAQLLARYGEHKTATILNNTGSVLLFGGTRDRTTCSSGPPWPGSATSGSPPPTCTAASRAGRCARCRCSRRRRSRTSPPGRSWSIRRGIAPVIGRARMAWTRRDVRAQRGTRHAPAGARADWRAQTARLRAWCRGRHGCPDPLVRRRRRPRPRIRPDAACIAGRAPRIAAAAWWTAPNPPRPPVIDALTGPTARDAAATAAASPVTDEHRVVDRARGRSPRVGTRMSIPVSALDSVERSRSTSTYLDSRGDGLGYNPRRGVRRPGLARARLGRRGRRPHRRTSTRTPAPHRLLGRATLTEVEDALEDAAERACWPTARTTPTPQRGPSTSACSPSTARPARPARRTRPTTASRHATALRSSTSRSWPHAPPRRGGTRRSRHGKPTPRRRPRRPRPVRGRRPALARRARSAARRGPRRTRADRPRRRADDDAARAAGTRTTSDDDRRHDDDAHGDHGSGWGR